MAPPIHAQPHANMIKSAIGAADTKVRGVTPRGGIETSPSRRESLTARFSDNNTLMRLTAATFVWCEHAPEAWMQDGVYRLGFVGKASKNWVWLVETCRLANLHISTQMNHHKGNADGHEETNPD